MYTSYFPQLCQEEFYLTNASYGLHFAVFEVWLQLECCPQNVISAKMYLMNRHYINIINVDVLLSIFLNLIVLKSFDCVLFDRLLVRCFTDLNCIIRIKDGTTSTIFQG